MMSKAILELPEMPESCETCPIKRYSWVEYICGIIGEEIANKGRRSDCPLKLVRGRGLSHFAKVDVYFAGIATE